MSLVFLCLAVSPGQHRCLRKLCYAASEQQGWGAVGIPVPFGGRSNIVTRCESSVKDYEGEVPGSWGRSAKCWAVQNARFCVCFFFSSDKSLPVILNFEWSKGYHSVAIGNALSQCRVPKAAPELPLPPKSISNFLDKRTRYVDVSWALLLYSLGSSMKDNLKNSILSHKTFVSFEEKVLGTSSSREKKCSHGKSCEGQWNSSPTHNS